VTRGRSRPWRYVPATELHGEPHVVVDGAPRPGTVLTLSHWPGTPTPRALWADTSAEIVLAALRNRSKALPRDAEVATVDHYDADGVIALAMLVLDGVAAAHGPRLVAAARAGDFDVIEDLDDALVAFALGALRRGGAASAGTDCRPDAWADATARAAWRALEHLPGLLSRPEQFEELWGPEHGAYQAALGLKASGGVTIAEYPQLDLAVVRVDEDAPALDAARWEGAAVHPGVVHSATSCLRVATLVGRRYNLRYRYESWVRLVSRAPRRRVDLSGLADRLTSAETDGGQWWFEGAGAITPALARRDGAESTLAPEQFVAAVSDALAVLDERPPAWDPYALHPGASG
jgi:hypothetical protein